jgi:1,2-diacylglycerol 3-alpha-glucosyltransferase/glucuronosyltransferase
MKLALVTDAWFPQTNGVVRTLATTVEYLQAHGVQVEVFSPQGFRTVPCPTYPEIRLALFAGRALARRLDEFGPDAIHIATEGPLGLAARKWCVGRGREFTTAYHTQFPEYLRARGPIPLSLSYAVLRWFHGGARRVLVATPSMQRQLEAHGFKNVARWSRGVDADLFRPGPKSFLDLPRPVWLYLGRVAVEKGIGEFLRLDLPGTKLVVGDGPARAKLETEYPDARFVGFKHGEELAQHVAACDAFVFPSRTDTFGLVLLEAMACGLPVAAYPVTGPVDVVVHGVTGVLDEDLRSAALQCLSLDPAACRAHALQYSWEACTHQFRSALAPMPSPAAVPATVTPAG